MKKLFVVLGICLCLCFGCAEDNRSPILPKAENVDSICIDFTNSIQKIYDDSESIQKILSEIATGKRTEKQSIQDYPSAEEYGTINIENNGGMTTMFYYEENGKYYIECPYKGIYEIEKQFLVRHVDAQTSLYEGKTSWTYGHAMLKSSDLPSYEVSNN